MNNYPPYDPSDPHSQPTTAGSYPQFPPLGQQPSLPQWGQQPPPPPPQFPTNPGQYPQSGQNFPQYPPQYPQPGQFGPPTVQQKPPPPSWKDPKARRAYFKQYPRSKGKQFMIGCGIPIIASVLLCSLCVVVGNALPKQPGQTAVVVIQSPTPVQKTAEATKAPTPTATPTPSPTPVPTPMPTTAPVQQSQPVQQPVTQSQPVQSAPAPTTGVNGNPWGYDFTPGSYIYSPNSGFCGYFSCISTFWNGNGYVEECSDGMYGKSGGISGSCSKHGGNYRPLYSH